MTLSEKRDNDTAIQPNPRADVVERSTWRSVALVATCTSAMMLNVSTTEPRTIAGPPDNSSPERQLDGSVYRSPNNRRGAAHCRIQAPVDTVRIRP